MGIQLAGTIGKTVLITGGGSGIGLAMASKYGHVIAVDGGVTIQLKK